MQQTTNFINYKNVIIQFASNQSNKVESADKYPATSQARNGDI